MDGKYLQLHRLIQWRELGLDWQPQQSFGRCDSPVFLEIGFGNGEYLLKQALARPQDNFLGLDLQWGSVRRALRRLAQAEVDNVRILFGDALMAVEYLLPDRCMQGFVALFPCPWPRRDQARLRLFSTRFMAQLRRICRGPGLVVTDHSGLRDFAMQQAQGSGYQVELREVEAGYGTKYERRWRDQGQKYFYELHYSPSPDFVWLKQAKEVPMRTLKSLTVDPQVIRLQGCQEEVVVHFRQEVFDPIRRVWMILTTVVEDSLNQQFWIEVAYHSEDGLWHIRPAQGGGYLPTVGVQRALELVQQSIESAPVGKLGRAES